MRWWRHLGAGLLGSQSNRDDQINDISPGLKLARPRDAATMAVDCLVLSSNCEVEILWPSEWSWQSVTLAPSQPQFFGVNKRDKRQTEDSRGAPST